MRQGRESILGKASFDSPNIPHWSSTGSPLMDLMIRNGRTPRGLPGGKWVDLYGAESSGKTAVCARAGAAIQRAGGLVVWLDPEHGTFDEHLMVAGMDTTDPDKFIYSHPFSLESCCESVEYVAKEWGDAGIPILIVIDSLSSLGVAQYSMDDTSTKDATPSAAAAKKLHEWWRRGILYYMSHMPIYGIMTRHLTGSPQPIFRGGGGDHVTHGKSLHFYAWLRIKMKREALTAGEGGPAVGSWLTATIKKSKVGPLRGEVSFPYYYDTGFDTGLEQICYLIDQKVLAKASTGRITWQDKGYYPKDLRVLYAENANFKDQIDALVHKTFMEGL